MHLGSMDALKKMICTSLYLGNMARGRSSIARKTHMYIRIRLWRNNNYSHIGSMPGDWNSINTYEAWKNHMYTGNSSEACQYNIIWIACQYNIMENIYKLEASMINKGIITRNRKEVWKHVTTGQKTANSYAILQEFKS